jgi:HSP20 family protein
MQLHSKYHPALKTKTGLDGLLHTFFNSGISDHVGHDALRNTVFVNFIETPDHFRLELAAPGFEKQDFNLAVENGQLNISAKNLPQESPAEGRFTRREFVVSSFERSFKLPKTVNHDAIEAVYENGVLQVKLTKNEEAKPVVKSISVG